jgi:hypothetical protein
MENETETVEKKSYAPSIVRGYVPKKEGEKAGHWIELHDGNDLKANFSEITLLRLECEKYSKVLKVRENKEAIYAKFSNLIGAKHFSLDFAVSLACKDFPKNSTKWIPKDASDASTIQSNLKSDWDN